MSDRGGIPITAALILTAVCLGVIDSMLPRPVPFMKIGLANLPAVIASVHLGLRRTLSLNLTRAVAVALLTGSMATPAFLMSLAGAASSAVMMSIAARGFPSFFSMTGVSISGACASVWSQLGVASLILPGLPIGSLALPATLWGIGSGALVGAAAGILSSRHFIRSVLSC